MPAIIGESGDDKDGDALRALETDNFSTIARHTRLQIFPGVLALLDTLRERGVRTAIATSSKKA
ncbi:MAG: hypothetical protein ABJD07_11015 [Gemmatimonadaceae bacterium]